MFALFGIGARSLRKVLAFALTLIVVAIVLRWWWVVQFNPSWDDGVKKVALLRIDAIAFGLAAVAAVRLWPQRMHAHRGWIALAGSGVILSGAWLTFASVIDISVSARVFAFSLTGLGSALLLPWLIAWRDAREVHGGAVVTALARWSYALYLAHMPIMRVWLELVPPAQSFAMAWLHAIGFVAVSVLVAALVYRWFERPVLSWRDRVLGRREQDTPSPFTARD